MNQLDPNAFFSKGATLHKGTADGSVASTIKDSSFAKNLTTALTIVALSAGLTLAGNVNAMNLTKMNADKIELAQENQGVSGAKAWGNFKTLVGEKTGYTGSELQGNVNAGVAASKNIAKGAVDGTVDVIKAQQTNNADTEQATKKVNGETEVQATQKATKIDAPNAGESNARKLGAAVHNGVEGLLDGGVNFFKGLASGEPEAQSADVSGALANSGLRDKPEATSQLKLGK